jgi:hypothetical protein
MTFASRHLYLCSALEPKPSTMPLLLIPQDYAMLLVSMTPEPKVTADPAGGHGVQLIPG